MVLFGALPPSMLPALVSVRTKVDLPKTADRKLLRLVNYLIQLAAGEGAAGTVVPFTTLLGEYCRSTSTSIVLVHSLLLLKSLYLQAAAAVCTLAFITLRLPNKPPPPHQSHPVTLL